MRPRDFLLIASLALLGTRSLEAAPQWSSNPGSNLAVADAGGDQVQPKIAPTMDGGCYVSWFDNIANGFDLRLQKLDANGQELWPHNGVLVLDRGFSSTQDYGLDVDAVGNALMACRDDSGSGTQISAAKVSPGGILLWGPGGITLTATSAFVAAPKIAGTSDGAAVVAWLENSSVKLQKLDGAGTPQWGAGLNLTPSVGSYSVADLHDHGTTVILSMVHQTGSQFFSPKHLVAIKFDGLGNSLWGTSPLSIFDSGSLQIGNFPSFIPDGNGGALFAWYGVSPLQVYAQHILPGGTEAFPHNGVSGSTNTGQVRTDPNLAYDAASGTTYMFWTEQNSGQSQHGLSGQRFDAGGVRQWGNHGVSLIPVGSMEIRQPKTEVSGTGAFVFWSEIPSFGTDTLHGAHVDSVGTVDIAAFDVASTPAVKSRLDVDKGANGQILLAWSDQAVDTGNILAQNVGPDGSLGPIDLGVIYCDVNPDNSATISISSLDCSQTSILVTLSNGPPNQFGYLLVGTGNGSVTDPPGALGDLCLLGSAIGRYRQDAALINGGGILSTDILNANTGAGGGALPNPLVGNICAPPGQTWNFQYWHRNSGSPSGFSQALAVTFQ